MRFKRFPFHPSPMVRTARKIKNAARAVRRELDSVALFPELARYSSVEERLNQIDATSIRYWQRMRDADAETWRKFRRRFASLRQEDQERFLEYWNAHVMFPGEACYASDTLTIFFKRDDWIAEDIKAIQGGEV